MKQQTFTNDKYEKHANVIECLERTKLKICFLSLLISSSNKHTFLPGSSKHLSHMPQNSQFFFVLDNSF